MPLGLTLSPARRVFAAFAVYSFSMGNIFPRLPDVQTAMGVGEGALGFGLIGAPVGTLLALTFASPVLERIGFRRAMLTTIPAVSILYAIAIHATGPLGLFLLLIPVGIAIGCVEIMLNLEADRAEHLAGYRIMNRAHAFWSIGFFAAGIFGAVMAGIGLSPQLHLALVVPIAGVAIWLFLGDFQPAPPRPGLATGPGPRLALPTGGIMLLVVVTLSAMLMEGASIDWSAIYLRDVFGVTPFIAGLGVAAFSIAQGGMRYFADSFLERMAPASLARALLLVLLIGSVMVTFSPAAWISLLGFALMGLGSSTIFPQAMSAAAQRTDRSAVVNIAALAQISFTVFLIGPPLLGFVAEAFGIRTSYGIAIPLVLLSLLTAGALGRQAPERVAQRAA
ncbi:MAG: MFS transporter [Rubellimicrobium sp.]|nr:MFS transporter [Rubellimicrobium sp.]